MIKETKHRLERAFYQGEVTVAYTICEKYKKNLFTNTEIFGIFEKILIEELNRQDFDAHIYLFMPDYVHIIVTGKNGNCNSLDMIKIFKQKTGFWLSRNLNEYKWQKDFYDHIIRDENDIMNQIYYILENPVRKGITKNWKDYQFKGSTIYNLDEIER